MIYDLVFFVSTLGIHGGTTFVQRFSKFAQSNEKNILVFCLFDDVDDFLLKEIKQYADVVFLRNFIKFPFSKIHRSNQLSVFYPLKRRKLYRLIGSSHVHVMGVFGLYFLSRLARHDEKSKSFSMGIYHQNEFNLEKRQDVFSVTISSIIQGLPPSQIIFFNDYTRKKLGKLWKIDTQQSVVTPIGIVSTEQIPRLRSEFNYRLVSVGNLVGFKTYNSLVISMLPNLIERYPMISYHIIGKGENAEILKKDCMISGVDDRVVFHGSLPFKEAMRIVEESDVFIGSGTAILEASMRYIPSIVGIETEKLPYTYGYISSIQGFDYNENQQERKKYKIVDCIDKVFESQDSWRALSLSCRKKAKEFCIDRTYEDFFSLINSMPRCEKIIKKTDQVRNVICLFSFFKIILLDVFNIDKSFRKRRDFNEI